MLMDPPGCNLKGSITDTGEALMPDPSLAAELPDQQLPTYMSAHAAAMIAGVDPHSIRRNLTPDAWVHSRSGERKFPLYLPATVEAYRPVRRGPQGAGR
jgi:hypothetical protein